MVVRTGYFLARFVQVQIQFFHQIYIYYNIYTTTVVLVLVHLLCTVHDTVLYEREYLVRRTRIEL